MMAAKSKNGIPIMHTAGIYSDMTVDGPEIGTLVLIVDRAKNLPSRKSIGKQDPYCAARLGKEAKKTETDKRGGQTPKWDQELRFTVHDSPDYYQLKVSVFNDDKKTDLIGETWINLQEVVVPGGGQNDIWHNLSCKGKYAGEIRIEITYYDTRPKQEKPADRVRQTAAVGHDSPQGSLGGPRQPKAAVKRRPLPNNPTERSPSPEMTPDHIQTPQRGFHTPPSYLPKQSPLQAVEYSTARIHRHSESRQYSHHASSEQQSPHSRGGQQPGMVAFTPPGQQTEDHQYDMYNMQPDHLYGPGDIQGTQHDDMIEQETREPLTPYQMHPSSFEPNPFDQYDAPTSPGGPPPPPPAHRTNQVSPAMPALASHNSYPDQSPQNNRFDLVREEPSRHSLPNIHNSGYQAYSPPKTHGFQQQVDGSRGYRESPPRHRSYDDRYSGHHSEMQPSVEDAPPSPSPHRDGLQHSQQYDDRRFDQSASPAPLNLTGRNSVISSRQNAVHTPAQSSYGGRHSNPSSNSQRDQLYMGSDVSIRTTNSQQSLPAQYSQSSRNSPYQRQPDNREVSPGAYQASEQSYNPRRSEDQSYSPGGYVPALPSSLVSGMDPMIAQEVADRIYSDRRNSFNHQSTSTPPRGHYETQSQHQSYTRGQYQPDATRSFGHSFDSHQDRTPNGTYTVIVKPRAISPNVGLIPRKSISPSPVPEDKRLSAIPFGPDDYAALNPNVTPIKQLELDNAVDPEAKIIMHDGREVDPSDHLPEHSWAPEPEVRTPKAQQDASRSRPSPGGAQPMPVSGRRPLRVAGRPQPPMETHSSPVYHSGPMSNSNSPAPAAGRNRLQKKSNRPGAYAAPNSSPLAPLNPYQDNNYNARSLPRPDSMDFAGENGYSTGSPGYRPTTGAPPVPAKVPIDMRGSGRRDYRQPAPLPQRDPEESAWALLEEMKSIDLGSGRARRRGRGHAVV